MAKPKGVGLFAVAATYVGTVVGAGFATGQEVMRFFTNLGWGGIFGLGSAALLFGLLGALVLELGHERQADSHLEIVEAVTGPLVGRFIDWVIIFFLFGGAAVMMAGSGAVFAEHWHLNRFLGTLAMAVLCGGTVLLGLRGVVSSISAVAPLLIGMVFVVGIGSVLANGLSPADLNWYRPAAAAAPWWPVSMFLYISYNLILSTAVLGPLGKEIHSPHVRRWGGMVGGIALGIGALVINLALMAGLPETTRYEVPMLFMAERLSPWVGVVYSIVLWAEVYTTAVGSLFGLAVRLSKPGTARFRTIVLGGTVGALLASQFGFSQLVGVLFPAVGWVGLMFIAGLLIRLLRPEVRIGE